jgi:hypothetical protein
VVINYRLAIGNVAGTYLAIAAGGAQVVLLWIFHATLAQVVWVQVGLMAALFLVLVGWDLWRYGHERTGRDHEEQANRVSGNAWADEHRRRAAAGDIS